MAGVVFLGTLASQRWQTLHALRGRGGKGVCIGRGGRSTGGATGATLDGGSRAGDAPPDFSSVQQHYSMGTTRIYVFEIVKFGRDISMTHWVVMLRCDSAQENIHPEYLACIVLMCSVCRRAATPRVAEIS